MGFESKNIKRIKLRIFEKQGKIESQFKNEGKSSQLQQQLNSSFNQDRVLIFDPNQEGELQQQGEDLVVKDSSWSIYDGEIIQV
ncbi:unnamed protein product [Paramecium octaurelia]|nr:unnamed protein product [Paramecium octaurelia]